MFFVVLAHMNFREKKISKDYLFEFCPAFNPMKKVLPETSFSKI